MPLHSNQRLLYFGMFGTLSRLPLAALLDAGLDVAAVVVPARTAAPDAAPIRILPPPPDAATRPVSFAALLKQTVIDLAWQRGIPVLEVDRFDHATVQTALADYRPALIAVSCFPHRFPRWLRELAPGGVLNLHPTPLPRGRGPDPLFWLFREPEGAGDADGAGVTIHLMDRGLDSGPLVLQERFVLADGTTGPELELRAASVGAWLLVRAAESILNGTAQPQAQDEARATVYPLPTAADYVVTPDRSARWAFNFLRGTANGDYPHQLRSGDRVWLIRAAQGFDPDATLPAPFVEMGEQLRVRCAPGVLAVTTLPPRT